MELNRGIRRSIARAICGKQRSEQFRIAMTASEIYLRWPYSEAELELARDVAALATGPFFHGGPKGLEVILPSGETGVRRWDRETSRGGPTPTYSPHRLESAFFTLSPGDAREYANACDDGQVYLVEPEGEILPDKKLLRTYCILGEIQTSWFRPYWEIASYPQRVEFLAKYIQHYCAKSARVVQVIDFVDAEE